MPTAAINKLLHRAIMGGDLERVKQRIWSGAGIESRFERKTPLMWAAGEGLVPIVDFLLKQKARVNAVHRDSGLNALMYAITRGRVEVARLLIAAGTKLEQTDSENMAPLALAARRGETEIVKALLEKGADPLATDFESQTALDYAVEFEQWETARALIAGGASAADHRRKWFQETIHALAAGNDARALEFLSTRFQSEIDGIKDEIVERIAVCDSVYLDGYAALPGVEESILARRMKEQLTAAPSETGPRNRAREIL